MRNFIEKSQIDKKLCVHCKHCKIYAGLGIKDRVMCDLYKDKVDDSELYYAWQNRYIPWKCGGRKWEIDQNITICKSKQEADKLYSEECIESFLPFARKVIKGEVTESQFTCGYYEKAKAKAKAELC